MLFQLWLTFNLSVEGSYYDDPLAGPTNFGIVQTNLNAFLKVNGCTPISVQTLTSDSPLLAAFYLLGYWTPMRCDKLPDAVAGVLADGAVNHGTPRMTMILQSYLGVSTDGDFGSITYNTLQNKISNAGAVSVATDLINARWSYYQDIPNGASDLDGWKNRLEKLAQFIGITIQLS